MEVNLLCNSCYNPLEVLEYDGGTYVERCTCEDDAIREQHEEYAYNEGYEAGREQGAREAFDDGFEEGKEQGEYEAESRIEELEDQIRDLQDEINDLETKIEEYDELACELEYNDRIGA